MKRISIFLAGLLSLVCVSSQAEVQKSAADGFQIQIKTTVNTTPEKAYQQFIKVNEWWSSDHSWFGDQKNFSIEAKAGGCFCEKLNDKQVLHMTVTYVEPNKELRMVGGLGPLQMMGVHGGMSWQFNAIDNGSTEIVQSYTVSGFSGLELDKLAPIVDKVQVLQQTLLTQKINQSN